MTEKDDTDEPNLVRAEYVYTGGFKRLADLKLRIGKWLEEERGWGVAEPLERRPERRSANQYIATVDSEGKDDKPNIVRGEYVQTGPNFIVNLKMRIGNWLEEERGW